MAIRKHALDIIPKLRHILSTSICVGNAPKRVIKYMIKYCDVNLIKLDAATRVVE
jgi:hypothetical protein